jgi:hypothetical protein
MIVDKLNVVVLDNWSWLGPTNEYAQELTNGGAALSQRYMRRMGDAQNVAGRVKEMTLTSSGMSSRYELGPLADSGHHGQDAGTYVIGHTPGFSGDTLGGLDPAQLAELLTSLAVVPVRKLCLLGCSSGYGDKDKGHKGSPVYLAALCQALKIPDLLVAGWRHFVTIGDQGQKQIKVPYNKKDAEPTNPNAESRKSQKVAYRWNDQSRGAVVGLDAWSDKTKFVYALREGRISMLPAGWDEQHGL